MEMCSRGKIFYNRRLDASMLKFVDCTINDFIAIDKKNIVVELPNGIRTTLTSSSDSFTYNELLMYICKCLDAYKYDISIYQLSSVLYDEVCGHYTINIVRP